MLSTSVVDAYFARIGYDGPRDPVAATLDGIAGAHVATIPFENLDVLLGLPIVLDLEAVVAKLVHGGRGGYCFEQNGLLLAVLETLGFRVTPISARVRLQRPREFTPPRTHVFVRVALPDGVRVVDVGVGGLSPTSSLRLVDGVPLRTPHETRRFVTEGGRTFHQALLGDTWVDVCEFTGEEMPPIDREVGNWFTSTHPASHFRSRLVVARAGPDGTRLSILNRELTLRGADGVADTRLLDHPDALLDALRTHFGLGFPDGTRFACPGLDWPDAS